MLCVKQFQKLNFTAQHRKCIPVALIMEVYVMCCECGEIDRSWREIPGLSYYPPPALVAFCVYPPQRTKGLTVCCIVKITWITGSLWIAASCRTHVESVSGVFVAPLWLQRSWIIPFRWILECLRMCVSVCVTQTTICRLLVTLSVKGFKVSGGYLEYDPPFPDRLLSVSGVFCPFFSLRWSLNVTDQHGWRLPFVAACVGFIFTVKFRLLQQR